MRWFVIALLLVSACGCASLGSVFPGENIDSADFLLEANHQAVEHLLAAVPAHRKLTRTQPIIVATLVNIDDLKSSRLGRTLSEHYATKLTNTGYPVVELKLRGNIFVKRNEGEMLLSREISDLTLNHKAQAVLVGTYSESSGVLYVTIKLVGMDDNTAIAAYDYVLPLSSSVRSMLRTPTAP